VLELLLASRGAATRRQRYWTGGLLVSTLAGLALAGFAFLQRDLAMTNEAKAIEQRDNALRTQSVFLADLADQQRTAGDSVTAALVAMEGLPDPTQPGQRPYVARAEASLLAALHSAREVSVISEPTEAGVLPIMHAAVDRAGTRLVTLDISSSLRIHDAATLKVLVSRPDTDVFLISGDGQRMVSISNGGRASLWDLKAASPIGEFEVPFAGIPRESIWKDEIALSYAGDRLLLIWNFERGTRSMMRTRKVELFDTVKGTSLRSAVLPGHRIVRVVFAQSEPRAFVETEDHTVVVHDIAGGNILTELKGHSDQIRFAAYSPDSKTIVTTSGHRELAVVSENTTRLWDASTGRELHRLASTIKGAVWSATFSPDGTYLVTRAQDMLLWKVAQGELIARLDHPNHSPSDPVFNEASTAIATASPEGSAVVWSAQSGGAILVVRHLEATLGAAFTSADRNLMTWSDDGSVRIWSLQPRPSLRGALRARARGYEGPWYNIEPSPEGTSVLVVSPFKNVQIGAVDNARDGFAEEAWTRGLEGVETVDVPGSLSPDGKRLIGRGESGLAVFDIETGVIAGQLPFDQGEIVGAAFAADGQIAAVVKSDPGTHVVNTRSPGSNVPLQMSGEVPARVSFSPDTRYVAVLTDSKALSVFDALKGTRLFSLAATNTPFHRFHFSRDGSRIVVIERDADRPGGRARIFSTRGGQVVYALEGELVDVALSPDGRRTAAAYRNGETHLIDIDWAASLHVFRQRGIEPAVSVAFARDGATLIIGSAQGRIERWPVWLDTRAALMHARSATQRCLTREQRTKFFLNPEPPTWCRELRKWPYVP
jgi:WD40 repeat protein